jgi:hypothetical protein
MHQLEALAILVAEPLPETELAFPVVSKDHQNMYMLCAPKKLLANVFGLLRQASRSRP